MLAVEIRIIAEGRPIVATKMFTVTLDDVVRLTNHGSVFGEARHVLVIDPVTGRVFVDGELPSNWDEAVPGQLAYVDLRAVARDLTIVRNSVLGDPGLVGARVAIGAQAAWYAEQPSMPADLVPLFRGLAERLIEAGLSDPYL